MLVVVVVVVVGVVVVLVRPRYCCVWALLIGLEERACQGRINGDSYPELTALKMIPE